MDFKTVLIPLSLVLRVCSSRLVLIGLCVSSLSCMQNVTIYVRVTNTLLISYGIARRIHENEINCCQKSTERLNTHFNQKVRKRMLFLLKPNPILIAGSD